MITLTTAEIQGSASFNLHPRTGEGLKDYKARIKTDLYKPQNVKGYKKSLNIMLASINSVSFHVCQNLGLINEAGEMIVNGLSYLHGAIASGVTMAGTWFEKHCARDSGFSFTRKTFAQYKDVLAGFGIWEVVPKEFRGAKWSVSEYANIDFTYLLWAAEAIEELLVDTFDFEGIIPEHKFNWTRLLYNWVFPESAGYRRSDPTEDDQGRCADPMSVEAAGDYREAMEEASEATIATRVEALEGQIEELEEIGIGESEPGFMRALWEELTDLKDRLFKRRNKGEKSLAKSAESQEFCGEGVGDRQLWGDAPG